ncbi:MAG: hypothetical protein JWO83_1297 [Caulobacteraceae bacterium]|nr:hypothetical protein [Caulobacteraceae bacterium]
MLLNLEKASAIGVLALFLIAGAATAAPGGAAPLSSNASSGARPMAPWWAPAVMDEAQLDAVSAGQSPTPMAITAQTLTASDGGNSISAANVQTGAVSFEAGALQGFNGIGNFVINTGNNNILQGSLSVTVTPLR